MCGTCVADHIVTCSAVGSTTMERGSTNAGVMRFCRRVRRMTTWSGSASAAAIAASMSPPVPRLAESMPHVAHTFVPRSGCTSGAPSSRAAMGSVTTGSAS